MAKLYISEYGANGFDVAGLNLPVASEPAITEQTPVVVGAEAKSAAFGAQTRFVRIHTDAICSILFGTGSPAATTNSKRLAADATEYFAVQPGDKVSVIANT